ncbi:hypothetical protein K402DRAFT_154162 [Aulographum hederae CBS 113979]|uniref:Uncharacterized protein n=1 Tax=Aulographum hederae CBS 113979 TaxID=1176131 RepID=A0A6G1GTC3_9PEZI|nr:hypothetical protein K402DRAFT_154162 [Aulographum hederae CBS 113979]
MSISRMILSPIPAAPRCVNPESQTRGEPKQFDEQNRPPGGWSTIEDDSPDIDSWRGHPRHDHPSWLTVSKPHLRLPTSKTCPNFGDRPRRGENCTCRVQTSEPQVHTALLYSSVESSVSNSP